MQWKDWTSNSIEDDIRIIFHEYKTGVIDRDGVAFRLTHLNFHPDWDDFRQFHEDIAHVVEDLAPDLEIHNGDSRVMEHDWEELQRGLRDIISET